MRNPLPAFPDIALEAWADTYDGQTVSLCHVGSEADLVAAGILSIELLAKRDPKAP
jgi:hypothetical protein